MIRPEASAESAKTIKEMAIAAANLKKARSEVVKMSKAYEAVKKVKYKNQLSTKKQQIRKYDAQKLTSNIGR